MSTEKNMTVLPLWRSCSPLEMLHLSSNHISSSASARITEYFIGPVLQAICKRLKMDHQGLHPTEHIPQVGSPLGRAVHHRQEQKVPNVLVEPRFLVRCFPHLMDSVYIYPPIPLMQKVLGNLREDSSVMIMLVPDWPRQFLYSDLMILSIHPPVTLPIVPDIISQKGRSFSWTWCHCIWHQGC